ncbi:non-canonical purine NTP pyrophosphatase [Patescibacteria group bacterium]
MQELLIATSNPGKFKEISQILDGVPFRLLSLIDVGLQHFDVEEKGGTFAENALLKAEFFANKSLLPTMAEDSGIFINALADELGIETRRWGAGTKASDQEWLDFFLERMDLEKDRNAKFVSNVCFLDLGKELEEFFDGETEGIITQKAEAPILPGLPLSSCFKPVGLEKVYAALSAEEKNKVSHRGGAIRKLKNFLTDHKSCSNI